MKDIRHSLTTMTSCVILITSNKKIGPNCFFCVSSAGPQSECELKCEESVEAEAGEMVVLPCITEPQSWIRMLDWTKKENMSDYTVHAYRNKEHDLSDQLKEYRNKTSLFDNELSSGNCSLKLSKVHMYYGGTYTCIVKTGNQKTCTCVVKLTGGYTIACASPIRPNKNSKMFFLL